MWNTCKIASKVESKFDWDHAIHYNKVFRFPRIVQNAVKDLH